MCARVGVCMAGMCQVVLPLHAVMRAHLNALNCCVALVSDASSSEDP